MQPHVLKAQACRIMEKAPLSCTPNCNPYQKPCYLMLGSPVCTSKLTVRASVTLH